MAAPGRPRGHELESGPIEDTDEAFPEGPTTRVSHPGLEKHILAPDLRSRGRGQVLLGRGGEDIAGRGKPLQEGGVVAVVQGVLNHEQDLAGFDVNGRDRHNA